MIPHLDIYRSAAVLVREHGEYAPLEAAMNADSMLDKGDIEAQRVRPRILAAVKELQNTSPQESDVLH